MAKQSPSLISLIPLRLLLSIFIATNSFLSVEGAKKSYGVGHNSSNNDNTVTLFVFGDSYVDTGNFVHSESYKPPNGITYPGYPAERFCDGRDLTDYDIPEFTASLVKQMTINLRRIHSLGVGKVAVGLLEPTGCLPAITVVTFRQSCIDPLNKISRSHSQQLQEALQGLNVELGKTVFITLDLYNSFLSTIDTMQKAHAGNSTLMNPLEQCCLAKIGYNCGSVDDKGEKKYSVCENPGLSFFWDNVHPSQNGWNAVYTLLQPSLGQLTQKNF